MNNYIIEKQELKGNAAVNLGKIKPEQLTFGNSNIHEKIDVTGSHPTHIIVSNYEIIDEMLSPMTDTCSSAGYNGNIFEYKFIIPQSFEVSLWNTVNNLFKKGKKQRALFTLFDKLNEQLNNPKNCNNFLIHVMNYDLSSDTIVHILNALSPIKHQLPIWSDFVAFSTSELENKVGLDKSKRLLKVVV